MLEGTYVVYPALASEENLTGRRTAKKLVDCSHRYRVLGGGQRRVSNLIPSSRVTRRQATQGPPIADRGVDNKLRGNDSVYS